MRSFCLLICFTAVLLWAATAAADEVTAEVNPLYYNSACLLHFSDGGHDIHRKLTNRQAAWTMNYVIGAAGRSYGVAAEWYGVPQCAPDFMPRGCRTSCLTGDIFSLVPKCWFSNQSGDHHRVGGVSGGGRIRVLRCNLRCDKGVLYDENDDGPPQMDMANGKA